MNVGQPPRQLADSRRRIGVARKRLGDMTARHPDWKSKEGLAVGKGATVQEFVAIVGNDKLEIDVAPGAKVI